MKFIKTSFTSFFAVTELKKKMGQSERAICPTEENFKTAKWFCSFEDKGSKPEVYSRNGFFKRWYH